MDLDIIKRETKNDATLQTAIAVMQSGRWYELCDDPELRPHYNIRDELCATTDGDILLGDKRIIIPQSLQNSVKNFTVS